MIKLIKKITLVWLLCCCAFAQAIHAQGKYPVYVTPTLLPPYSLTLSDYGASGSQHLNIAIHVNDLNVANLPVKLLIKLESPGVTIETPKTLATTPIYINGGETSMLYGDDLADYLNIKNLIFKGYSKESYKRTGQLPGGFYRFTVQVLHYATNRLISNTGTTSAWMVRGKPPVLLLPEHEARMGRYGAPTLTFSWDKSNVGSPVSAGTIQYRFEMWEMRLANINPATVAASSNVFHEHTTLNTTYTLIPSTLLLEPGMKYAWRVTAFDAAGMIPFEQDGKSQVRTFTYKGKCEPITNLTAKALGSTGRFEWKNSPDHTSFNIEMGSKELGWSTAQELYDNKLEYHKLEQGVTYEIRVQGVCYNDPKMKSDFSERIKLEIPLPKPLFDKKDCPDCGCDLEIKDVELENFDLRTDLASGDTIVNKTNTSRFILTEVVDNGDGNYSGKFLFWLEVWGVKVICDYENLQVNTDDVIVNVDFESVYDPKFLIDVDAIEESIGEFKDALNTLTTSTAIKDTIQLTEDFDFVINRNDTLFAAVVDDKGEVTTQVISTNAKDNKRKLIKSAGGKECVVSSKGQPMGVKEFKASRGGTRNGIKELNKRKEENDLSEGASITFTANQNQKYGFDTYTELKAPLLNEYPQLTNGYRAAFKSIQSYGMDRVNVDQVQNVLFKDEMGIPATLIDNSLMLRGMNDKANTALYAYSTTGDSSKIIGKLNLLSYDPLVKNLCMVSVNGAKLPSISTLQTELDKIYKQAVCRWTIERKSVDNVTFEGQQMTHGGSGALAVYNNDQRAIVNKFTETTTLDRNVHYLFFVDDVKDKGRNIEGFNPLQRNVGFIYNSNKQCPSVRTIAHEIAHGAFNLRHTFSQKQFIADCSDTENLMDYKGGTELWKHQWQQIHNPQKILFDFLQKEEEGEYTIQKNNEFVMKFMEGLKIARQNKQTFTPFTHQYVTGDLYSGSSKTVAKKVKLSDGHVYDRIEINVALEEENEADRAIPYLDLDGLLHCFEGKDFYLFEDYDWEKGKSVFKKRFSIKVSSKDCSFMHQFVNSNESGGHLEELYASINGSCDIVTALFDKFPDALYEKINYDTRLKAINCLSKEVIKNVHIEHYLKKLITETPHDSVYTNLVKDFSESNEINENQAILKFITWSDFSLITFAKRKELIKEVAKGSIAQGEEQQIIHLLKSTPKTDIDRLLSFLQTCTIEEDESLVYHMNYGIDDGVFGEDSYTELMTVYRSLMSQTDQFLYSVLETCITKDVENGNVFVFGKEDAIVGEKRVTGAKLLANGDVQLVISRCILKSIQGDGKVQTHAYKKDWSLVGYRLFKPFELIAFTNKSGVKSIDAVNGESIGKLQFVPAIMMRFAADKKFNVVASKVALVALDVSVIALSLGTLGTVAGLSRLAYAYHIFNCASAGTNLVINLADLENDPKFKEAVGIYNQAMMAVGIIELLRGSPSFIRKIPAKIKNFTSQTSSLTRKLASKLANMKVESFDAATKLKYDRMLKRVKELAIKSNTDISDLLRIGLFEKLKGIKQAGKALDISSMDNIVDVLSDGAKAIGSISFSKIKFGEKVYELKESVKVVVFNLKGKIKCYIEGGYCFTGETPILLANTKTKRIDQIKVGDTVATYNHNLKRRSFGVVKKLFKRTTKKLTQIAVAGSMLMTTPSHQLYADGEYRPAGSLTTQTELLTADNQPINPTQVATIDSVATVYNFEIGADHNYYAGDTPILVHNTCSWKTILANAKSGNIDDLFSKFHLSVINAELDIVQRKALFDKIAQLGDKSNDFIRDFAENADALKKFAANEELVKAWKKIENIGDNSSKIFKNDIEFLEVFEEVSSNTILNEHLFKGDVTSKIGADGVVRYNFSGVHSNKAFKDGTVRIKSGVEIEDLGDGFYKAKIERQIEGFVNDVGTNWKVKKAKSTFFPDSWSAEKIQAEIAHAFKNKTLERGYKYSGFTTDGKKITIFLDESDKIKTAFPDL